MRQECEEIRRQPMARAVATRPPEPDPELHAANYYAFLPAVPRQSGRWKPLRWNVSSSRSDGLFWYPDAHNPLQPHLSRYRPSHAH